MLSDLLRETVAVQALGLAMSFLVIVTVLYAFPGKPGLTALATTVRRVLLSFIVVSGNVKPADI